MDRRGIRYLWLATIFVIAVVELLTIVRSPGAVSFAVAAVVASVWGVHCELARIPAGSVSYGPATARVPAPPPVPAPRPMVVAPAPATAPPRPAAATPRTGDFPAAPRFGRPSRAHTLPWLLPSAPAGAGVAADQAYVGDLEVRAASVIGAGHRCEAPATARQDAYRLGRDSANRHLVVAVADGVSSAEFADVGAAEACAGAVKAAVVAIDNREPFDERFGRRMFGTAAEWMRAAAKARGNLDDRDVYAVLVVAVIEALAGPDGRRHAWIFWLGDVSVWSRVEGRWAFVCGDRKLSRDGVESGAVEACLPPDADRVEARRVALAPGEALALVSDGVGDALHMVPTINEYLAARWATPPPVPSFLNDVCFEVSGHQDDRTAAVVWTPPVGGAA